MKNVGEAPHFEVLVETIFESTSSGEEEIKSIKVTKGLKKGQLFIYAKTVYESIIIYEVDLYAVKNSVTELGVIEECNCFGTTQLYPIGMFKPAVF